MEGRHKKLLGIFAMLLFVLVGLGAYATVGIYFEHRWSLLFIVTFFFLGILCPEVCHGYRSMDDPILFDQRMSGDESYANRRDLGYVLAAIFILLTYIVPSVAWIASGGTNPPCIATVVIYVGNTSIVFAFECLIKIFFLPAQEE